LTPFDVYRPAAVEPPRSLPVVVWIHGGFFLTGSKNTDFCPLVNMSLSLDLPVIVVAINYRLGPLGFGAFKEAMGDATMGNYGLADQIMALEWVKAAIFRFNGDPNRVTIMGESAGGHAVNAHLGLAASAGLFVHAIAESAKADHFLPLSEALRSGELLRQGLQASTIAELRQVPAKEIVACLMRSGCAPLVNTMRGGKSPLWGKTNFGPTVGTKFFPAQPRLLTARGRVNAAAVLMGSNSLEGSLSELEDAVCLAVPDQCDSHEEAREAINGAWGLGRWNFRQIAAGLWGVEALEAIQKLYPASEYAGKPRVTVNGAVNPNPIRTVTHC